MSQRIGNHDMTYDDMTLNNHILAGEKSRNRIQNIPNQAKLMQWITNLLTLWKLSVLGKS